MVDVNLWNKTRKEQKITLDILSIKSGIPLNTLKNIFSGRTPTPRIDTVQSIERALGITNEHATTKHFSKEEQELLTAFRELNASMRAYVLQIVKSAVYAQEETAENKTRNNIKKIGG